MTLDIQNLDEKGRRELICFCSEKVAHIQFQAFKMSRALAKRQAQEQKWLENLVLYQKRKAEGEAALQVLSESNPYYHKIRLDVQKCEIRIMELEIRLQRFSLVQKAEKITNLKALEASINYYQTLIREIENTTPFQNTQDIAHLLVDRLMHFESLNVNGVQRDLTDIAEYFKVEESEMEGILFHNLAQQKSLTEYSNRRLSSSSGTSYNQ